MFSFSCIKKATFLLKWKAVEVGVNYANSYMDE